MNQTLNKVILIGHTGDEIKLHYYAKDVCVGRVSIATDEVFLNSKGEKYSKTQWHSIVFKNHLAEAFENTVPKGSLVYIEGSISTREWTDNNGISRQAIEIYSSEFKLLK